MTCRLIKILTAIVCAIVLVSCSAQPTATGGTVPQVVVERAWVRTTEGATNQTMTGAFMDLTNPGDDPVTLVSATTDVAGMTEIHEMVPGPDGKAVMRKAEKGAVVPAGSHLHLVPGGFHVMLMKLAKPLPIGDEVTITLTFSNGQTTTVTAPVKKFTEEEDTYHTHEPSTAPKG